MGSAVRILEGLRGGKGYRWAKSKSHRVRSRAHSPPAPPWSPLAALAKPRLKDLRGRAIAVREARNNSLSFHSPSPSRGSSPFFLGQSPVESTNGWLFLGGFYI